MKTRGEIYRTVREHLLTQYAPSREHIRGLYECAYRGKYGRKSAVGCLITDDAYDIRMEGMTVMDLFEQFPGAMRMSGIPCDDQTICLLDELELIHDYMHYSNWKQALDKTLEHFSPKVDLWSLN